MRLPIRGASLSAVGFHATSGRALPSRGIVRSVQGRDAVEGKFYRDIGLRLILEDPHRQPAQKETS